MQGLRQPVVNASPWTNVTPQVVGLHLVADAQGPQHGDWELLAMFKHIRIHDNLRGAHSGSPEVLIKVVEAVH